MRTGERRDTGFSPGTRVKWIETGETGIVTSQFIDGYVALRLDDGSPAELYASSLKPVRPSQKARNGR